MQAVQSDNKNPKIYAMIIPIKNEGADMPTILAKTDDVSIHEPFLTAASTPNGMPITTAINMAANARIRVPGNASVNSYRPLPFV
jgi:hypothetical protein